MGRGRVVVRYNHLKAVRAALPVEMGNGVDEIVDIIDAKLQIRVWRRTGILAETIKDRDPRKLHATISIGLNKGRGFYSRFLEWGTVKLAPRPVVGPVAHESEPIYVSVMTKRIRKACNAK